MIIFYLFRLSKKSGANFSEMIFFDDLEWNIRDAESLGIQSHLVPNGVSMGVVRRALEQYDGTVRSRNGNH